MAYYSLKARFFVAPNGECREKVGRLNVAVHQYVWKRARGRCELCGRELERFRSRVNYYTGPDNRAGQVDHILPRSRGGSNDPSNLRLICEYTNLARKAGDDEIQCLG